MKFSVSFVTNAQEIITSGRAGGPEMANDKCKHAGMQSGKVIKGAVQNNSLVLLDLNH